MTAAIHLMTAEQLLENASRLGRSELVRGELVQMSPAGGKHGNIAARMLRQISNHVEQHDLGKYYAAETGFVLSRDPDTVRAPDVAFIRHENTHREPERGFVEGAPDLAVEVLSPDDRAGAVIEKVRMWLASGCLAVWVVDPESRTVTVYGPDQRATVLDGEDHVTGGDLLPGFDLPVSEIFAS